MTTCMSSSIRIDLWLAVSRRGVLPALIGLGLAGCEAAEDNAVIAIAEPQDPAKLTGTPALPPSSEKEPAAQSSVISMEDMSEKFAGRDKGPGCFITFAYRGYAPETLIWDGEPCRDLTARFGGQAFLEQYDNWARLDAAQQADIAKTPDGEVFYVEGQFTASIYPIGITGLTYEVVVTD